MVVRFDPENAEKLQRKDRNKHDQEVSLDLNGELSKKSPEEKKKELTPAEAANEYLDILDDLSKDFTYPYYTEERKGRFHSASSITPDLGRQYSKNPHHRWQGHSSTEAGIYDGTMLRISSADAIIGYEIGWRKEGGAVAKKVEEYQEKITELDKNYETKGRLAKFFGKRKYEKRRDLLLNSIRDMKMRFRRNYSDKMEKELAISYDDSGYYGFDYDKLKFASEERSSKNEEYNRRFFGLDDPARMAKVERAILLRQKYKDEWAKEVKKHKFTMAFEGKY